MGTTWNGISQNFQVVGYKPIAVLDIASMSVWNWMLNASQLSIIKKKRISINHTKEKTEFSFCFLSLKWQKITKLWSHREEIQVCTGKKDREKSFINVCQRVI